MSTIRQGDSNETTAPLPQAGAAGVAFPDCIGSESIFPVLAEHVQLAENQRLQQIDNWINGSYHNSACEVFFGARFAADDRSTRRRLLTLHLHMKMVSEGDQPAGRLSYAHAAAWRPTPSAACLPFREPPTAPATPGMESSTPPSIHLISNSYPNPSSGSVTFSFFSNRCSSLVKAI